MKKFLREPLVHFLLLGGCLFMIAGWWHRAAPFRFGRAQAQTTKIVITPGDVDNLISSFTATWRRPPTPQELSGLIDGRIREEVYYREAIKLGLDRDDAIIRSRLQEKLEFLSQDTSQPLAPPSEDDLKAFFSEHPDDFRAPTKYSFRVAFVDAGLHGAATVDDATALLRKLRGNPAVAAKGDPLPSGNHFEGSGKADVAKQLGNEVAAALDSAPLGQWSGPVKSLDGVYLLYVERRATGKLPSFDEIKPEVLKEYQFTQRRVANDKQYQALRQNYDVTVELPKGIRAAAGEESAPQ